MNLGGHPGLIKIVFKPLNLTLSKAFVVSIKAARRLVFSLCTFVLFLDLLHSEDHIYCASVGT